MIVAKTHMSKIPKNCLECKVLGCPLPTAKDGDKILKSYMKKRHKCCPLIEIEEDRCNEEDI